jgi:membrane-bound ClpP family serine protease
MSNLPFGKKNYQMMVAGLLIIMIGFVVMMLDKEPHGFGFLGITLSPVIVLTGFIVEVFAILHTPKDENK